MEARESPSRNEATCDSEAPAFLIAQQFLFIWNVLQLPQFSKVEILDTSHTLKRNICPQWVNYSLTLPDVQAGFRKGRGTRDQIVNIRWIMEKAREFQKNIYFCFIDYAKAFDFVDHNELWKILKEMGIPDHLICLLRNLYAGQEATVRTGHGTTDVLNRKTSSSRLYIVTLLI